TGQARAPGRVDLRPPATSAGTPGPARPAGRRPRKTPRNPSQGRGMLIPMTVRGTSAVLVGREAELATLRAALKRADTTEPVTVLLGGEAGVGKTRLVDDFGRYARTTGALVLVGRCTGLGEDGPPFAPFVAALRELLRRDGAPAFAGFEADFSRLLPELAPAEPA